MNMMNSRVMVTALALGRNDEMSLTNCVVSSVDEKQRNILCLVYVGESHYYHEQIYRRTFVCLKFIFRYTHKNNFYVTSSVTSSVFSCHVLS